MNLANFSDFSEVLSELEKIKSNSKGKLINLGIVNMEKEMNFLDKNILISEQANINFHLEKFSELCRKNEKTPCIILFSRNYHDFSGIISRENLMLVGVENLSAQEMSFIAENKIRHISLNLILEEISDSTESIMEFSYGKELFLIVDSSIFDIEAGGLLLRHGIYILSRIGMMKNLKVACFSGFKNPKILARLASELF